MAARWTVGAAAQEATPNAAVPIQSFAGETFVGATEDGNTFVAIVLAPAQAGTTPRAARAYLCNGADIDEWFDQGGLIEDDARLDLRSSAGAQLSGSLTAETAAGTITLPGGAGFDFEARRATGAEGLFTVAILPDGRVEGTSAEGARLDGQLLIAGTIALGNGETADYQWPLALDDTAELRVINRAEGESRGAGRTPKGKQPRVNSRPSSQPERDRDQAPEQREPTDQRQPPGSSAEEREEPGAKKPKPKK
jgi:hypothetical protein